jgi:hypothetical protein
MLLIRGVLFLQLFGVIPSRPAEALPVLIQHVASSANPVGVGISGNNYKIPLPNPVLAGDALVLAITYPHGETITISDTLKQTYIIHPAAVRFQMRTCRTRPPRAAPGKL